MFADVHTELRLCSADRTTNWTRRKNDPRRDTESNGIDLTRVCGRHTTPFAGNASATGSCLSSIAFPHASTLDARTERLYTGGRPDSARMASNEFCSAGRASFSRIRFVIVLVLIATTQHYSPPAAGFPRRGRCSLRISIDSYKN